MSGPPIAGLTFDNVPYIDGTDQVNAWIFQNGTWLSTFPLMFGVYYGAVTNPPFPFNLNSSLLAIGGKNNDAFTSGTLFSMLLTKSGWQLLKVNLPTIVYGHCMILTDSATVWVIGGCSGFCAFQNQVHLLNPETLTWSRGPDLMRGRTYHTCSMILKNASGQEQTKIVVGGYSISNQEFLDSVEVYDDQSNMWVSGPQLSIKISNGAMITDQNLGIILVGGNSENKLLDTFYRLKNSGSQWERMQIKLKTPRADPTAFYIPNNITNCN